MAWPAWIHFMLGVKVGHNLLSNFFPFILLSYNVSLLSEIYFYLLLTYWLDLNWYIYQEIWRLSIANWPTIASYGSNSFLAMIKFIIVISFNGVVLKVWYPNVHFGTKIEKNAGGGLEVLYISSVKGSWRSPVSRCSRKGIKTLKTFWSSYFWKINQQLKIEETMP